MERNNEEDLVDPVLYRQIWNNEYNRPEILEKSYYDRLTEEEIDKIVQDELKFHKQFIEEKIKKNQSISVNHEFSSAMFEASFLIFPETSDDVHLHRERDRATILHPLHSEGP